MQPVFSSDIASDIFSALPVRSLLKATNYQTDDPELKISLGLIWGTGSEQLEARKHSHLTHSTAMDHQIRFPLNDRVERALKKLAMDFQAHLVNLNGICDETLHGFSRPVATKKISLSNQDYISRQFFKHLPQFEIVLNSNQVHASESLLSEQEINLLSEMATPHGVPEVILGAARERIYAGDYSAAEKILRHLSNSQMNLTHYHDEINYMRGLCCNFFGRTAESEFHFRKLLESANPLSFVQGSYVLSMLYLRMHPKEQQDLATAANFLQTAYQLLEENPQIKDHTFHQVFNRNGYALCLFREGKIREALNMLDKGIERLQSDPSGAAPLHQSVLIYNSVQCLRALGEYAECERRCQDLLHIDPLFPEYSLEISKILIDQRKFSEAFLSLARAENLDPWIAETQALKAFIYVELGKFELAAEFYRRALHLNPEQLQWNEDLEYCVEELATRKEAMV